MRLIYTLLLYLCIPLILLRLLWRSLKAPAYARRWSERFGFITTPSFYSPLYTSPPSYSKNGNQQPVVWVHAVSVGETLAAASLIQQLLQRESTRLVITTTTPTGSEQVQRLFGEYFGERVFHCYAPYDLPDCINRFLRKVKPTLCIIMETELWPNIVNRLNANNIPVMLANGRLSERSFRGYQKISWLIAPVFSGLTKAAVQQSADAARMQSLGLKPENCVVTGNIKFDLTLSDEIKAQAAALKTSINTDRQRPVWIAASTHKGEDEMVINAHRRAKQKIPNLLLVIAPRHPERFLAAENLALSAECRVQRRSETSTVAASTDVLLSDSIGELLMLYGCADIAFVGGSLLPVGGHNLIEPAAWGLPILSGKHVFNFAEASRLLLEADALTLVDDTDHLVRQVVALAKDKDRRKVMGENAREVAEQNRGALEKLLQVVNSL